MARLQGSKDNNQWLIISQGSSEQRAMLVLILFSCLNENLTEGKLADDTKLEIRMGINCRAVELQSRMILSYLKVSSTETFSGLVNQ